MSDASLFDLFIQGASNEGGLTEANKWLPPLSDGTAVFRKREILFYFFSLCTSQFHRGETLEMKTMLVRVDLFIQTGFVLKIRSTGGLCVT